MVWSTERVEGDKRLRQKEERWSWWRRGSERADGVREIEGQERSGWWWRRGRERADGVREIEGRERSGWWWRGGRDGADGVRKIEGREGRWKWTPANFTLSLQIKPFFVERLVFLTEEKKGEEKKSQWHIVINFFLKNTGWLGLCRSVSNDKLVFIT